MAATFIVLLLPLISPSTATRRGLFHRTAFLHALSYWPLYVLCVVGRDQHPMQEYLMMHNQKTLPFLNENTILLIWVFPHAKNSSLPTKEFNTILLSGAVQVRCDLAFSNDNYFLRLYCRPRNKEELFNLRHASA
jgi:hypothetical protein